MEGKDPIYEYLGALCEVLTQDNRLLFVGIIQDYNPESSEAKIQLHKGGSTPQGIVHRTAIKLQVHNSARSRGQVAMLYGSVTGCAPEYWWVEIQNSMFCVERRQSFRQPVSGLGLVTRPEEGAEMPHPCQLVDISLRGVGFLSREHYSVGDKVILDKVQLLRGKAPYTFSCQICRVQPGKKPTDQTLYGCSFYDMSQKQEDRLCQAIFAIQAQSLNRRRSG